MFCSFKSIGLWSAALSGDVTRATSLLQSTNANIRDESGFTPLHYACRAGKLEICKLLVSKGADVNAMVIIKLLNTNLQDSIGCNASSQSLILWS
jgi:ankyrin repeat protein